MKRIFLAVAVKKLQQTAVYSVANLRVNTDRGRVWQRGIKTLCVRARARSYKNKNNYIIRVCVFFYSQTG